MKKYFLLFLLCIKTTTVLIFGQNSISEADIPLPEIIYELPESLIGEFIMVTPMYEQNITIFSNNKYIISSENQHFYKDWSWGHIVKINDVWYFSRLDTPYGKLQEIQLLDNGFSYSIYRSMRKENMPVPTNPAEGFSLPRRMVKHQYFEINNSIRVDFSEIIRARYEPYAHALIIDNGIVTITRGVTVREFIKSSQMPELAEAYLGHEDYFIGGQVEFIGVIDLIEENNNGFKGIIRFTNGVPYYYIENGTAQIEKINDDIIITMLYMPFLRDIVANIPDRYQFPAKLILEF